MDTLFGEVISSYSRAQAIEDGVLADVSSVAREAGFKYPVAISTGVYSTLLPTDQEKEEWCQDFHGRLWDMFTMLRLAIKGSEGQRVDFTMGKQTMNGFRDVQLYSLCGPGDNAEPVITVMLPEED